MNRKRQPTHPGGILKRHYIEPLNLTISVLADDLRLVERRVKVERMGNCETACFTVKPVIALEL